MSLENYLDSVKKQFLYYKNLGDQTFKQLKEEAYYKQPNDDSNGIAVIIQHLHGNMLSRWTDFLTTDGEKEWRQRDTEFENQTLTPAQLLEMWEKGWACLFSALNQLTDQDLEKIIYIRNQGHTVMEAINRQLAHYPYHVGQIVFLGKMYSTQSWESLSIPKGNSGTYNAAKFSQEKSKQHFIG
jgi:hypothetical protein